MTRIILSLDGIWQFWPDADAQLTYDTLEHAGQPRDIRVPGPWQAQFADLRDYSGVAWYRQTFALPATSPTPSATILRFGAVDYHTTVWLNGQCVGEHEGGYLPFELPLDAALREGQNELVVRVIDPDDDEERFPEFTFAEIPHGKQSWYGQLSGIWQSVTIETRPAIHFKRLKVTADVPGQQALVEATLSTALQSPLWLLLRLTDAVGQEATHRFRLAAGEQLPVVTLPVPDPLLWDTVSPQLYHLEATLAQGDDEPLDQLATTFGMRTITTSPEGYLMLNGRILYLRGALDQDYYPDLIYTPFDDAALHDQFAKAKHMGLNCLRTHIKITDPRYYDAADRAGILIWTELPNWENLTQHARRRARDTIAGMVERDWNHPSIIIWTIINEGWGVDLAANADHRAWLAETYAYLKALDPTRLVVGNSPCFSNFHVVTDIEDFHNYYAIPDHYRQWRDWVQVFASRPPWTFAYTYDTYSAWSQALRDPWNPLPRTAAPEVQRRGNEPMVVSEFGNWGLPDVEQLKACYGGEDPWWFETGQEWGDGVVYPHGIEQRFRLFHLHKVFGTLANLSAASQRMQFTALKYQIEQMRRHPSIVGYIITEFTDVHWECNGLLDMCRNPKAFHDVIGNINRADAIVPDWERVVFWEGERCEVRLALSHFSSHDLSSCRLEWNVDLWEGLQGSFEALTAASGHVANIGTVVFDVPPVAESMRARLELRLLDCDGQLVTSNHHEFYVFPRTLGTPVIAPDGPLLLYATGRLAEQLLACGYRVTDSLKATDMAVVETLTDDLRWYLQNGGRVLWLAETPAAKETHLGGLGIAQRHGRSWQGDWASSFSWLRQDRLFGAIPTGGVVDFAFADLTPESVIVGLKPSDFGADVHAGLFVGWLHHTVALIAERQIGNGHLLVSTFRIVDHLATNPVARVLLNDTLRRLAANE